VRDAIFVVGTGRTGSSALTRVLGLCGGALPLRTLPANFANPTGYWEPELSVALNDRFLEAHRSSWYDETLRLQLGAVDQCDANALVRDASFLLAVAFESNGPLVVKDPRISALLPYWTEAAYRAGLRTTIVHNFRNPVDVAASLASRDGLSTEHSDALWLKYNLLAERETRAFPRVFVSYEELLDDWEGLVERCARELGVAVSAAEGRRDAVEAFLSAGHRHHGAERADVDDGGGLVSRTYATLREAQRGNVDAAAFDELFAAFASVHAGGA
jgi:hypothetical protein